MIPIIRFIDANSFLDYIGNNEISQQDNGNAYTRLFNINNKLVAKLYVGNLEQSQKNIKNICIMYDHEDIHKLSFITKPISLLELQGKIVGYTMPFIQGTCLDTSLQNPSIKDTEKMKWFSQLAKIICTLPDYLHIGDLHGGNIIVDASGNIKLIDVDGFSVDNGHQMTCPLFNSSKLDLPNKYYDANGNGVVNKNSDIMCLFRLFFYYILGQMDFLYFPFDYKIDYLSFLTRQGASKNFVKAVYYLFKEDPNFINEDMFIDFPNIDDISYSKFLKKSTVLIREIKATEYLKKCLLVNIH